MEEFNYVEYEYFFEQTGAKKNQAKGITRASPVCFLSGEKAVPEAGSSFLTPPKKGEGGVKKKEGGQHK